MPSPDTASGLPLQSNEPLKPFTTFKIGGPARYFLSASSADDFRKALALAREERLPLFVLGGGSNILVSDRGFDGLVIHPSGGGIQIQPGGERTFLTMAAAESWDNVVQQAVESRLWGIENLSHIPGQAGAALVQNIGAYGQQIGDVFQSATVMEIATGSVRTLGPGDCGLGYRRSIFNTAARGQFVILGLTLALTRAGKPNLSYPDVRARFAGKGAVPSLAEIRQAIIAIRDGKFPFPREERGGNAGSFFKNLELTPAEYATLAAKVDANFSAAEIERLEEVSKRLPARGRIKVPTAFLIDICGLKGYQVGGALINEQQPLVILNQGGATARDVLMLAQHIRRTVFARTGMTISLEPELVGFTQEEIAEFLSLA